MRSLRGWIAVALLTFVTSAIGQEPRRIVTSKGEVHDRPKVHELEWWTEDPLRLDESDDMRFFQMADDGHAYTPLDYKVEQVVTPIGVVAGRRIVEVIETIYFEPRMVELGVGSNDKPAQWKSLLVETSKDKYFEIYRLQALGGDYQKLGHASIYGSGVDAVLATSDAKNEAGECADGYWWFDRMGAHPVDFSPSVKTMGKVVSRGLLVTKCGEMRGNYRIVRGVAIPVKVSFKPASR